LTAACTAAKPPGRSVRQISAANSAGRGERSKPPLPENSKSNESPENGCQRPSPWRISGGDGFLKIPTESTMPTSFRARTSSPAGVSMQRAREFGERKPSAMRSWKMAA
ncbi:hypothetical protein V8G54_032802, partial [Vigna mungo]